MADAYEGDEEVEDEDDGEDGEAARVEAVLEAAEREGVAAAAVA